MLQFTLQSSNDSSSSLTTTTNIQNHK